MRLDSDGSPRSTRASSDGACLLVPDRSFRALLGFIFAYSLLLSIVGSVEGPFLRSIVACDVSQPIIVPASNWSGSPYCGSKLEVVAAAQRLGSSLSPIAICTHMLTGPFLAAAADHHSRLMVIFFSVALTGVSLALLLLATMSASVEYAATHNFASPLSLLVLRAFLDGLSTTSAPINALVADLIEPALHAHVYLQISVAHALAGTCGSVLGIFLMRLELDDYRVPSLAAVLALPLVASVLARVEEPPRRRLLAHAAATSPERRQVSAATPVDEASIKDDLALVADTKDVASQTSAGTAAAPLRPAQLAGSLLTLFQSSAFLRALCASDSLIAAGFVGLLSILNSFVMAYYDWRQGDLDACMLAVMAPATLLAFAALIRCRLIERLGAAAALYAANALALAGWTVVCLLPFHPAFLLGLVMVAPVMTTYPATLTLYAQRFKQSQLAQVQSLTSASFSVGMIAALPTFAYLFDATAQGSRAALPFALSYVLVALGVALKLHALSLDGPVHEGLLTELLRNAPPGGTDALHGGKDSDKAGVHSARVRTELI